MCSNRIISGLWMSCDESEGFYYTEAIGATVSLRLVRHALRSAVVQEPSGWLAGVLFSSVYRG